MGFSVLTAEVAHETNTFSIRPTDLAAFQRRILLPVEAAIAARGDANTELAGFLDVGRERDWRITHAISAVAGPGGRVTREAFDTLCAPIVEALGAQRFDGILLALHGAMVLDDDEDGEGALLARIRALTGPDIPIAITLDPHANVTAGMCELADIIVAFRTYPHVDMRETAVRAGRILERTMAGDIAPRTIRVSRPMLEEVNGGRTDIGPMIDRLRRAEAFEGRPDVFAVSINAGFASADIAEVGPTVLVTGEGPPADHIAFAETLADDIWEHRREVLNDYLSPEDACAVASEYSNASRPLIIADYADNPGAGAYGDSTTLLGAMVDADLKDACFGPLVDPASMALISNAVIGDRLRTALGGRTAPDFGGGPLELDVTLVSKSDGVFVGDGPILGGLRGTYGPTAVVRARGIDILITSIADQMRDLQQFRAFGIDPAAKRIVALKSMQHFRAAFEPIAGRIIVCDTGALGTTRYGKLVYTKVRRPIFPLDDL